MKPLLNLITIFGFIIFAYWQSVQRDSLGTTISEFLAKADIALTIDSYVFNENTNTVILSLVDPNSNISGIKSRLRKQACQALSNNEWQLKSLNVSVFGDDRNELVYSSIFLPNDCI